MTPSAVVDLESVMRRVRKLLAIAQDSRGDPHECATAARMAEAIIRKYQIEHVDAIRAELETGDAFGDEFVSASLDTSRKVMHACGWASMLAVPVARLYDCQARAALTDERGRCMRFSGYRVDVELAKYTYEFVVANMAAATRLYLKGLKKQFSTRGLAGSFRRGYVSAVTCSLDKHRAERDAELRQAAASLELVICKEAAVSARYGEVRYGSGRFSNHAEAFDHGRRQGAGLDVGRRGVGGGVAAARIG